MVPPHSPRFRCAASPRGRPPGSPNQDGDPGSLPGSMGARRTRAGARYSSIGPSPYNQANRVPDRPTRPAGFSERSPLGGERSPGSVSDRWMSSPKDGPGTKTAAESNSLVSGTGSLDAAVFPPDPMARTTGFLRPHGPSTSPIHEVSRDIILRRRLTYRVTRNPVNPLATSIAHLASLSIAEQGIFRYPWIEMARQPGCINRAIHASLWRERIEG